MLELGKVDASNLPTGGLRLARVATDWSSFEEDMMEVVGLWQHERKRKHPTLCFRKLAGWTPGGRTVALQALLIRDAGRLERRLTA